MYHTDIKNVRRFLLKKSLALYKVLLDLKLFEHVSLRLHLRLIKEFDMIAKLCCFRDLLINYYYYYYYCLLCIDIISIGIMLQLLSF